MQSVHDINAAIAELENKRKQVIEESRNAIVDKVAGLFSDISREELEFVIQAAAEKCGVILAVELVKQAKPKAPAKYCNPENGKKWSGLGKPPKWFDRSRESEFLIVGNAANPT